MSRVLKWPVPIDDQWHQIGVGPIALVGPDPDDVGIALVWTVEPDEDSPLARYTTMTFGQRSRSARVVGTGHEWFGDHLGSFRTGIFVWHVIGLFTTQPENP